MNPFTISGFAGSQYFCDRKEELLKLTEAFVNKRNVTLFSIRRMGKSSLIKYLFEKEKNNADCIYLDIFPSTNFQEFVQLFANSVTKIFGKTQKDYLNILKDLIKSINASVSFDNITGNPEIKIGIGNYEKQKKDFTKLIDFLERNKRRVLFAIDEFQTIVNYPEKNTEALLRTYFQDCKNISFIFSGSNNRIMQSIFSHKLNPFYQSTQFLMLEEIDKYVYKDFIKLHFTKLKIKIQDEQIESVLDICRCHTYYVQLVCNRLYSKNIEIKNQVILDILGEIMYENEPIYQNYKNTLTNLQWHVLKAISMEGEVFEPYSMKFIKKYNLSSPSSVSRAIKSITDKGFISYYKNKYIIEDVIFSLWLKGK